MSAEPATKHKLNADAIYINMSRYSKQNC